MNPLPGPCSAPAVWCSRFGTGAIVVSGFLLPFYFADNPEDAYRVVGELLGNPFGKLFLFLCIAPSLYYTAHRLYHGLNDLHIQGPQVAMLLLFYGGATILTVILRDLAARVRGLVKHPAVERTA